MKIKSTSRFLGLFLFASALVVHGATPSFQPVPIEVDIPVKIRGFMGEKPPGADHVTYSFSGQDIRGNVVDIPKELPTADEVKNITLNPFSVVAFTIEADKIGSNALREMFFAQEDRALVEKNLNGAFNLATEKMFTGVDRFELLLALKKDDGIYVFYRLIKKKDEPSVILLRVLTQAGESYLCDLRPVSDRSILNVFNYLVSIRASTSNLVLRKK